jgi:hypothetical protein
VLRWVWNREGDGSAESNAVIVEGDAAAIDELRRCIVIATQ